MTTTIERKALHAAVWKAPATTVAARYGITSTALAKICRKLGVPAPPRGYWAQIAAGQSVPRAPLPKARPGQPTEHVLSAPPKAPAAVTAVVARIEGSHPAIVVPDTIEVLHPLLIRYVPRLRAKREDRDIWRETDCIAIHVSREALDRALRVMHAILVALDERGIAVEVTRPTTEHGQIVPSRTIATVGGSRLAIGLTEEIRTEISEIAPSLKPPPHATPESRASWFQAEIRASMARTEARLRAKHVPTGQLTLWIDPLVYLLTSVRRRMRDTEHQRVESLLNKFVVQLQLIAELVRQKAEDDARRRQAQAETARQWAIEDRLRERQKRLEEDLARRSASLVRLRDMRALIAAVDASEAPSPSTTAWIAWARGHVEIAERATLSVDAIWEQA
jgi:hypothetical protein